MINFKSMTVILNQWEIHLNIDNCLKVPSEPVDSKEMNATWP